MKICSTCKIEKESSLFQKRKASSDGLTSSCSECLKIRDKLRYSKEREYRLLKNKEYLKTEKGKESHKKSVDKWKDSNKNKRAAHVILGNAIKYKKITKLPCLICGNLDVEGHHPDYDRPLDVIWLCTTHHNEIHKDRLTIK